MPRYLAIRNPGVADYMGFVLMGLSGTRKAGCAGTIGQFGTGSKYGVAALLRYGIDVIICCGNLKMTFITKPISHEGEEQDQILVKFSGKDKDGQSKNTTESLGTTTELGTIHWNQPHMPVREFIANAIDACLKQGLSHTAVELDVVDSPRAARNDTTVYIEYTPRIAAVFADISKIFLHFGKPGLLNETILPKTDPEMLRVYKNGVLVLEKKETSLYDYNLADVDLNESRVLDYYEGKSHIATAWARKANQHHFTKVLTAVQNHTECVEASLSPYCLNVAKNPAIKAAFRVMYGDKAVLTRGMAGIDSFVEQKGYKAVPFNNDCWRETLQKNGVETDINVLDTNEMLGREVFDASHEMTEAVEWVWNLLTTFNLTKGKPIPSVKGFNHVMEGGSQCYGYFTPGTDFVVLHKDLGGSLLRKVALEECVHYLTGATDGSRDIQDFLFKMIVDIAS